MLSHGIRATLAMIDSSSRAYAPPCAHVGELPSLTRPGLFGD
jgi:hypothetical protein